MFKCWTCGSNINNFSYSCSACNQNLSEIKNLQQKILRNDYKSNIKLDAIAQIQLEGFKELSYRISEGFEELASCIEWGFNELYWRLDQQTEILKSIDEKLGRKRLFEADELRIMAEMLRQRTDLEESEITYKKSLEINKLDFRTYIGLSHTLIQRGKYIEAKKFLNKSLKHAPIINKTDYKSVSYRLIAHIFFCEQDFESAYQMTSKSIELSNNYYVSLYDHAQYCSIIGKKDECLTSLSKAIEYQPLYWYLSGKEKNFKHFRNEISELLVSIRDSAYAVIDKKLVDLEKKQKFIGVKIFDSERMQSKSKSKEPMQSVSYYDEANTLIKNAKKNLSSNDYDLILKADEFIKNAKNSSKNALTTVKEEYFKYLSLFKKRQFKRNLTLLIILSYFTFFGLIGLFYFDTDLYNSEHEEIFINTLEFLKLTNLSNPFVRFLSGVIAGIVYPVMVIIFLIIIGIGLSIFGS